MNEPDASLDAPASGPAGYRYVIGLTPPVPAGFYGTVRYEFQAGALVSAVVEERLKP